MHFLRMSQQFRGDKYKANTDDDDDNDNKKSCFNLLA